MSDNAETISERTARPENLIDHAKDWLNENQTIANPSKFHPIILKKDQADVSGISLSSSLIYNISRVYNIKVVKVHVFKSYRHRVNGASFVLLVKDHVLSTETEVDLLQ